MPLLKKVKTKNFPSQTNATEKYSPLNLNYGSSDLRESHVVNILSQQRWDEIDGSTVKILNERTLRFRRFASDSITGVKQPICFDVKIETGSLVEIFAETYSDFKIMGYTDAGIMASIFFFQGSKELSRINKDSIFCGSSKFDFTGEENLQVQYSSIRIKMEKADVDIILSDRIQIHAKIKRLTNNNRPGLNLKLTKIDGDVSLDGIIGGLAGAFTSFSIYEQISCAMKMESLERRAIVLFGGRLSAAYLAEDELEKCWLIKADSLSSPKTLTRFLHS